MGNPLEEELSEADDYNNRVVRSASKLFPLTRFIINMVTKIDVNSQNEPIYFSLLRVLAELQKLDGLPVIRGDQEEEQASHSLNISFYLLLNSLALQVLHASFCKGVGRGHITFIHRNRC